MKRETIKPVSRAHWLEMRKANINSTECPAIFGMSPYETRFELWHRKKDNLDNAISENERMRWGNRLETAIARGVAEDYNLSVIKNNNYISLPEIRAGSTFDFSIQNRQVGSDSPDKQTNAMNVMVRDKGAGILEIKNVDRSIFYNDWTVDAETKYVEAPAHIELQLQHQLAVSGRNWGVIAALVGGNAPQLAIRVRDNEVTTRIYHEIAAFWKSIEDNEPPSPEFPADVDMISKLYGFATPGKVASMQTDEDLAELCAQYKAAGEREALAKQEKGTAKAQILMVIGDAEKVLADGYNISAGMVGPTHVEYDREGFRNFRVTQRKAKAA